MTTDPARYRHRTEEIEAVQWTGSNAEELRAFCGPDFEEVDLDDRTENPDASAAVRESKHGTWRGLEPGYWVVKIGEELYEEAPADFAAQFEPAAAASDAVVAVLPPPADRAATYREVADRLAADAEQGAQEGFMRIYKRGAASKVREWADELADAAGTPLSPYYEHPACGFHWHGRDGMDIPLRDGEPVCPRCELAKAQTAVELLRRTESYLSAMHGSVARHDNLGVNLGCAGCELRDQVTAELRRLAAEAQQQTEPWTADGRLKTHILPAATTPDQPSMTGGFDTSIEIPDVTTPASSRAAVEEPATETPVVCEGFQWIGQPFTTCDRCARPAWEHAGEDVPVEGAGPFDNRRTVRPWGPGEADRIRAKWARP